MMASFCFALFSFQLDKVDETIIFVIIRSRGNVIAEDFCRCRALARDQGDGKIRLGILGFPLSFLFSSDCGLVKVEGGSHQALQASITMARSNFRSSLEQQRKETQEMSMHFLLLLFFLHTQLYWNALYPKITLVMLPNA